MTVRKIIEAPLKPSLLESSKHELDFRPFIGIVEFVDYERQQVAVRDVTSEILYERVEILPANSSSYSSTDVVLPEKGTYCICQPISQDRGFVRIAVIQWVLSNTITGIQTTASRVDINPKGSNLRRRGIYRKVYPGEKSTTNSLGFTRREDGGWDKQTADLSRDKLDTNRRIHYSVSGGRIVYTESGLSISGPVDRPGSTIKETILPDGTTEQILYLKEDKNSIDRFKDGAILSSPIVENVSKVQEFGLDFPVPLEILRDKLLDSVLGVTAEPLSKTKINTSGDFSTDDQTPLNTQNFDNPLDSEDYPVGPALKDGITYRRKGYIIEKAEGTLVGYNLWDSSTYGEVLKPILFPNTKAGRFSSSLETGYLPVNRTVDEVETLFAASTMSIRFPHEYNTTRLDVTKEGLVLVEIGSTIPKENISIDGSSYEHPHGAGRSLEMHTVGSIKTVIGKNRDEEESLDLATLGQVVLRLGADDSSLPDARRQVLTQIRSKSDSVGKREFQYWKTPKLSPGDSGSLTDKTGAENISLRAAFDGAAVLRLGARNPASKRKHLMNGYRDGKGTSAYGVGDASRKDSRSDGRPTYGSGDSIYSFHDLSKAGSSQLGHAPYFYSGPAINSMDAHGLSLDVHAVRDILLRAGANEESGVSLALDLGGGLVAWIGKDKKGRSITASLDGGAEITISANNEGRALQIEFAGDVNAYCRGNWHQKISGDYYLEATNIFETALINNVTRALNIRNGATVQISNEAPDIANSQQGSRN